MAFSNDGGVNTVLYAAARNGPIIFFKIGVKALCTGTVAMLSVCEGGRLVIAVAYWLMCKSVIG